MSTDERAFPVTWFGPPDRPVEGGTVFVRPAVTPDAAETAPGVAAERSAVASEGSGPQKRSEGDSGPKEDS